jgi:putative restriction endonuclease
MKFWWVSHNQTFKHEFGGGYMWSPKLNKNGKPNPFWETMLEVNIGDIVFSFAGEVKGIGVVTSRAISYSKPDFGKAGKVWNDEGWLVEVSFAELQHPFKPRDYLEVLGDVVNYKYGPLKANGEGKQQYLSEVNLPLLEKLKIVMGDDFDNTLAIAGGNLMALDEEGNQEQSLIEKDLKLGILEVHQLVKARRGQGIFKSRVKEKEKSCRITGLELSQHLIASHIKPWAKSDNLEKIDGNNGLLLSPHVDHLFDNGYISFRNNGEVIFSKNLQYRVLSAWHIDPDINAGKFNKEQAGYLEFHRDVILKSAS